MNKYKLRYIIFITLNLINILIYPFINYAGIVEIHYELWLGIVLVYMPAAAFILSLIYGMIFKGFAVSVSINVEKRFVHSQMDKSQAAFPQIYRIKYNVAV